MPEAVAARSSVPRAMAPGPRSQARAPRARSRRTERASQQRGGSWTSAAVAEDAAAPRVASQGEAAGWRIGALPGGLARDIMHAARDSSEGRPTTPEAVSSANRASMREWMERVATSMRMSSVKKSSLTSLLDDADAPENRPQIYCFSPGRNSVQTLSSVLASASAPSLGRPEGDRAPQRECEINEAERLAFQAALEKRVRNASFLRGDCAPRPLSRTGNQLIDTAKSRPRGLLDAPAAGDDADYMSFLRGNLKSQDPKDPGAKAVQQGLLDHAGRVAGIVDRMQRADQRVRRPTLHDTRTQCARGWSSWIVRPSGDDETGEQRIMEFGPSLTTSLSMQKQAPPAGRSPSPGRKSDSASTATTAERARKALLKMKAEKKQREVQAAAEAEKKRVGMAVIEAAKQRESEAYSRRLASVRSKLSHDAEERKGLKTVTGGPSTEQRRAPKTKKSTASSLTGPERIKAAQLRYSDRSPQQAETTAGGFYWTEAEEETMSTGSEGEAKAAAHFERIWARGKLNAHHRYRAPPRSAALDESNGGSESNSDSESDSGSEDDGRKVKNGFKFRDPDAWDRRFESQAAAPLKLKDEWYVGGECEGLQSYIRRRVVPGTSCVLQIGCGNSNLAEQLHDSCGLKHLINLDLSATVIDQMRMKRPDLRWMKGDALVLSEQFGQEAFDAVIDKGTLQSVLLMRGGIELSQVLAAEIYKVLRPGGRLVCVVGVQPGLAQYLKGPGLRWRISFKSVEGDGRPISIYTLTKPLTEASETVGGQQQQKFMHHQQKASTVDRIATNLAAREIGFKIPQTRMRAPPSQRISLVEQASQVAPRKCTTLYTDAMTMARARRKQPNSQQGKMHVRTAISLRADCPASITKDRVSSFTQFGSTMQQGTASTSEDEEDEDEEEEDEEDSQGQDSGHEDDEETDSSDCGEHDEKVDTANG